MDELERRRRARDSHRPPTYNPALPHHLEARLDSTADAWAELTASARRLGTTMADAFRPPLERITAMLEHLTTRH